MTKPGKPPVVNHGQQIAASRHPDPLLGRQRPEDSGEVARDGDEHSRRRGRGQRRLPLHGQPRRRRLARGRRALGGRPQPAPLRRRRRRLVILLLRGLRRAVHRRWRGRGRGRGRDRGGRRRRGRQRCRCRLDGRQRRETLVAGRRHCRPTDLLDGAVKLGSNSPRCWWRPGGGAIAQGG